MNAVILSVLLGLFPQKGGHFKILSTAEEGVKALFSLTELDTTTIESPSGPFIALRGGYSATDERGKPRLPFYVLHVALPPGSTPRVRLSVRKGKHINLSRPILPSPEYTDDGLTELYRPDPELYRSDSYYPPTHYEVEGPYTMRHQRYAAIRIYPFRYNPRGNVLEVAEQMEIQVTFVKDSKGEPAYRGPDPFEKVYSSLFANYEQGKRWRVKSRTPKSENPFDAAGIWFKIKILDAGLYEIRYADLRELGLPENIPISSLTLFSYGGDTLPSSIDSAYTSMRRVAVKIEDDGDGYFNGNDRILFYGLPLKRYRYVTGKFRYFEHPYADTNVYWLGVLSESEGPLMAEKDGTPSASAPKIEEGDGYTRHEENLTNFGRKGILWEGEVIQRNKLVSEKDTSFTFEVEPLASPSGSLSVSVVGGTGILRQIIIAINGIAQDSFWVSGITLYRTSVAISGLQDGENTITLKLKAASGTVDSTDRIYLDYLDLHYKRRLIYSGNQSHYYFATIEPWGIYNLRFLGEKPAYLLDVTDPLNPALVENIRSSEGSFEFSDTLLSGKVYFATNSVKKPLSISLNALRNLRSETDGVDYILITARRYLGACERLLRWRSSHLYLFDVEDSAFKLTSGTARGYAIEDIYDEFGFGLPDPVAIRNFIKYIYDNGTREPTYLVLMGDGTYDYKNRWGTGGNIVPPYEPWEIIDVNNDLRGAYDDFYADMDGSGGDNAADIFIGRIPIRQSSEISEYTDKAILYESGETNGPWRNRAVFVADDEYAGSMGFEGFYHVQSCDEMYRYYTPPSMEVDHLYLIEVTPLEMRGIEGKERLIGLLNRGAAVMTGFMHGNPRQLTHEVIFLAPLDFNKVDNGRKNPFIMIGSCKVASFDRVEITKCIAEDWAVRSGAGIGVLASATLSSPNPNEYYFKSIFQDCVMTHELHPLGEAVRHGKNNRYYLLLGDPGVPFRIPKPDMTIACNDTMQTAASFTVSGTGAQGNRVSIRTFGVKETTTYTSPQGSSITYLVPPYLLFNGSSRSEGGDFTSTFFLPSLIDTGDNAKIIAYDPIGFPGHTGARYDLVISRNPHPPQDTAGPHIKVLVNGIEIETETTEVTGNFELRGILSDPHGINLTSSLPGGESGISLIIGGSDIRDLTKYFEYYTGSDTIGSFSYPVELSGGGYVRIDVKAFDNLGRSSVWGGTFHVTGEEELAIQNFLPYPNPLRDEGGVSFTFTINREARVILKIFTIAGRLIWKSGSLWMPAGENSIYWNGRDGDGDLPSNGLYFVKILAKAGRETDEAVEKLLIAR